MLGSIIFQFMNMIYNIFDINFKFLGYELNLASLALTFMAIDLAIIIFVKLILNTSVASGIDTKTNHRTGEVSKKFVFGKRSR